MQTLAAHPTQALQAPALGISASALPARDLPHDRSCHLVPVVASSELQGMPAVHVDIASMLLRFVFARVTYFEKRLQDSDEWRGPWFKLVVTRTEEKGVITCIACLASVTPSPDRKDHDTTLRTLQTNIKLATSPYVCAGDI